MCISLSILFPMKENPGQFQDQRQTSHHYDIFSYTVQISKGGCRSSCQDNVSGLCKFYPDFSWHQCVSLRAVQWHWVPMVSWFSGGNTKTKNNIKEEDIAEKLEILKTGNNRGQKTWIISYGRTSVFPFWRLREIKISGIFR